MTPNSVKKRTKRSGGRGTVTTSRKTTGRDEVTETKDFADETECANPAYVGVTQGMTKNMGDYNSVKIGVHISIPCLPEDDDIRRAYARASKLASEFMDEEYEQAVGELEE